MPYFQGFPPCWNLLPQQTNSIFIISLVLSFRVVFLPKSKGVSLRQFAKLLKFKSFYRKTGQMAKPGKMWYILAVNRSQNVVFYGPINYSCLCVGSLWFAVGSLSVGSLLNPWTHFCGFIWTHDRKINFQYNLLFRQTGICLTITIR